MCFFVLNVITTRLLFFSFCSLHVFLTFSRSEAVIPGRAGRIPTRRMLHLAKKKVLTFLQKEEKKEKKEREKMMKRVGNGKESMKSSTSFSSYPLSSELASDVVRAFQIASGERVLRFDWDFAKERVKASVEI